MTISRRFTKNRTGGIGMKSECLWQVFLDTGAPELYMLYSRLKKVEGIHVFEGSGTGSESDPI